MSEDQMQKIYSTILDIQYQVSDINRQTGEQTEKLVSIEEQTIKTNGRVTKLEDTVQGIQLQEANTNGGNKVKTAIYSAIVGVLLTVLAAVIVKKIGF